MMARDLEQLSFPFFRHLIPRRIFTSHSYDARLEFDEFSV